VGSPVVVLSGDIAFYAAAAWPSTILGLWAQGSFSATWRRRLGQVVLAAAGLSAVLLSFSHAAGLLPARIYSTVREHPPGSLELNALFFLWLGALVFLPGRLRGRFSWISAVAVLAGISLATIEDLQEQFPHLLPWLHPLVIFAKPFDFLLIVSGGLFGLS